MAQRLAGRLSDKPLKAMNLAPMIGVLLAVFAVVTVTSVGLGKPVNLEVEPCSLGPPPGVDAPQRLYISFQRGGPVYVGQKRAASVDAAVEDAVREARTHDLRVVSLRADADVQYATVVAAVRGLNAAGLKAHFLNEDIH